MFINRRIIKSMNKVLISFGIIGLIVLKIGAAMEPIGVDSLNDQIQLAKQGDAEAQCKLGIKYKTGEGASKYYSQAAEFFKNSAEQGNATAQLNLGVMYANGEGVEKNASEAFRFTQLAAQGGNPIAQRNLGILYSKGEGVEKNCEEARKYFGLAASNGAIMGHQWYVDSLIYKGPEGEKWLKLKECIQTKYVVLKNDIVRKNKTETCLPSLNQKIWYGHNDPKYRYGGVHGDKLFQELTDRIVIPELVDFLREIRLDLSLGHPSDTAERYRLILPRIYALLTLAGEERHFIAKATGTDCPELFGDFMTNGDLDDKENDSWMVDPIESWPAWYILVTIKLRDILLNLLNSGDCPRDQIGLSLGKHLIKSKDGGIYTLIIEKMVIRKYDLQCYLFKGDKIMEDHRLDNLDSCFYKWINLPGSSTKHEAPIIFTLTQENLQKWTPADLWCGHQTMYHPLPKLVESLFSAITWDPQKQELNQLETSLGQSYWELSQSSLYKRGQAAISNFLVRAIFGLHGYPYFSWPSHWQSPKYASADMQALTVSKDVFVEEFKNVSVYKNKWEYYASIMKENSIPITAVCILSGIAAYYWWSKE